MRRFKTTPRKKIAGMVILFVLIPVFLIWYWVFFLDNKPGLDTGIILAAASALLIYLHLKYRKQLGSAAQNREAREEGYSGESDESDEADFPEEGEFGESGGEIDGPAEKPSKAGKQK